MNATSFLHECGAVGPLVFRLESGDEARFVSISKPYAFIGIDSNSEIAFDREMESARCAYLQVIAGRLMCISLHDPANHERQGRQRFGWLDVGHAVIIGNSRIRLISGVPPTGSVYQSNELPEITVVGPENETQSFCRPLTLVGNSADCQVRLDRPGVSPFHAALIAVPQRVWVVRLLAAKTSAGDESAFFVDRGTQTHLRLGEAELRLHVAAAVNSLPAIVPKIESDAMARPESSDAVTALARHFAETQQQMFSQFDETIAKFMNTVGAMHSELVRLLQQEMERVDRLDKELGELRVQQERLGVKPAVREKPAEPRPVPTPIARESAQYSHDEIVPREPESAEVHAWLSQRVADLQQERLGIWTRMRSYLNRSAATKVNKPELPTSGSTRKSAR